MYSVYNNTDSEQEAIKLKIHKRKHPITGDDPIDLNTQFDNLIESRHSDILMNTDLSQQIYRSIETTGQSAAKLQKENIEICPQNTNSQRFSESRRSISDTDTDGSQQNYRPIETTGQSAVKSQNENIEIRSQNSNSERCIENSANEDLTARPKSQPQSQYFKQQPNSHRKSHTGISQQYEKRPHHQKNNSKNEHRPKVKGPSDCGLIDNRPSECRNCKQLLDKVFEMESSLKNVVASVEIIKDVMLDFVKQAQSQKNTIAIEANFNMPVLPVTNLDEFIHLDIQFRADHVFLDQMVVF